MIQAPLPLYAQVRNCYGYARVSTNRQTDKGYSVQDQIAQMTAYCKFNKLNLIEVVCEPAISGSEKMRYKRTKLTQLLKMLPSGCSIIVTDIGRLSRSLRDFLAITKELELKKCQLIVIIQQIDTGSPYGRFNAGLAALLNQLEIDMTAGRIANIRRLKIENGEFMGRIPYGWKKLAPGTESPVIEVPEEQAVIKLVHEWAAEKDIHEKRAYTDYAIAKKLEELRVRPPGKAKKWAGININRILKRKTGPAKDKIYYDGDMSSYTAISARGLPIKALETYGDSYTSLEEFEMDFLKKVYEFTSDSESEEEPSPDIIISSLNGTFIFDGSSHVP